MSHDNFYVDQNFINVTRDFIRSFIILIHVRKSNEMKKKYDFYTLFVRINQLSTLFTSIINMVFLLSYKIITRMLEIQ